ncbi:exo-beta-N-acetylmuramidase NamZ domain-containing protein [Jannaschia sp. R86511]|uniref:exo-beta-N-acetylmuramidase NamZ family protein n=1 Tax=Jannaschia sp. R86511 TaxID=3093853 RepID=UPI0036D3083B
MSAGRDGSTGGAADAAAGGAGIGRRGLLGALGAAGALAALPGLAAPAAAGTAAAAAPGRPGGVRPGRVVPGVDVLAARGWSDLAGQRVGVVTNPTGVLMDLRHEVDVMAASGTVDLVAVFGPEHGFRGTAQAGDSEGTYVDERTGVTVYDAYGADADALAALYRQADVETVVFDIQDVGSRFYTYIWTMYDAMVAAARTGVRFVVLDRPNPVGGYARGPMMTTPYTTFVGKKEIVQQHGMTVGELARYFDAEFLAEEAGRRLTDLHVVEVDGWRRELVFADTGLPWVAPSPNMPTPDTALLYPGTCLFEGTLSSEGRGTTRPFEWVGDPAYDWRWAEAVAGYDISGVAVREAYFTPTFSKHAGQVCAGLQVHVTDRTRVEAITVAVAMLVEARRTYPDFAWRQDAWDTARPYWVDKLSGSPRLREMVDAGASVAEVEGAWAEELAAFERRRGPHLLYRGRRR